MGETIALGQLNIRAWRAPRGRGQAEPHLSGAFFPVTVPSLFRGITTQGWNRLPFKGRHTTKVSVSLMGSPGSNPILSSGSELSLTSIITFDGLSILKEMFTGLI